jgi:hypothetical protein
MSQCLKKPIFNTILNQEVGTQQFLHFCIDMSGRPRHRTYLVAQLYHNFTILCYKNI